MRTPLFLLAGFLLLTSACIVGKLLAEVFPAALNWATFLFLLVWCALAGANLIGGVTRAGYSVGEEIPVFMLIFGLPAIAMLIVRYKLL